MLTLPLMFQDHMVLQKDKIIKIWGKADADKKVNIMLQGRHFQTRSDGAGRWDVSCGPFVQSFCEKMRIQCEEDVIELHDVQIGEVWIAGGQSNMEFYMRYDADLEQEKSACPKPNIRFLDYPKVSCQEQAATPEYTKNYGIWRKADAEQLERFSAAGYYFAKDISGKYNVPVGIIGCNWGGTPACAWMSEEAIKRGGGQVYLDEYNAALEKLDLEKYDREFGENMCAVSLDPFANEVNEMLMQGVPPAETFGRWQKIIEKEPEKAKKSVGYYPLMGPKCERRPCGLYKFMLSQVAPYTSKGILWYQGETDGDCHPEVYETLFTELIREWRRLWGEDLPFLFVQIAPLEHWMDSTGEPYVKIRSAQQKVLESVPGTAMAVITDLGSQFDIHPKKKQPVGHRLALLAEHYVYGDDIECEAPMLSSVSVSDGELNLFFEYAYNGLYLEEVLPDGKKTDRSRLEGLQVLQDGCILDNADFSAEAEGNCVHVYGSGIKADRETEVRLAKTGWYCMNLYNSAGLPARPGSVRI